MLPNSDIEPVSTRCRPARKIHCIRDSVVRDKQIIPRFSAERQRVLGGMNAPGRGGFCFGNDRCIVHLAGAFWLAKVFSRLCFDDDVGLVGFGLVVTNLKLAAQGPKPCTREATPRLAG